MKFLRQILTLFIAVIITVLPLIPVSSAAFTGDDRIKVVLDPGHGGKDPGAAGINTEAYYNLQVALAAKAKLEADGNFIVYMTRSTPDKNLTLAQRLVYADSVNADVVISIHFNSSASSSIGGVEVYGSVLDRFYLGTLGQKISTKVGAAAGIQSRGVFRKYDYGSTLYYWSDEYQWDIPNDSSVGGLSDYYGIITWGAKFGIPSLIVEHAYLSNAKERQLIEDPAILKAMGKADADALIEYYTNHTHSYGGEIIDAPVTCFSAGKKSVHCTVCGHRINVTNVAASPDDTKHIWLSEGETTAATCESDGHAKFYCRYTHNLNDKGCTEFEVHRKDDVVPALGHDYQITEQREVTHTVDGITTYSCSRCSHSYSETIAAEGHSYTLSDHADPDCVNDGHDTYTCPVCNESYSDSIPALGHTFEVNDHSEPTCEADGYEVRKCTVCAFEETAVLPATGHDMFIYSDVMPNCTEEGLRITKCSTCGKTEETVMEITGHNFASIAEIAPTCVTAGESKNQCIVCQYEETVILDPTGHNFEVSEEVAATCTAEGYLTKICISCGETIIETVAAAGHRFEDATVIKAPGLFITGEEKLVCASDPTHIMVRAIPGLNLQEYKNACPVKFWTMCGAAAVIVIGIAVVVIVVILRRRRSPSHAKSNIAETDIDTVTEELPDTTKEKEPVE